MTINMEYRGIHILNSSDVDDLIDRCLAAEGKLAAQSARAAELEAALRGLISEFVGNDEPCDETCTADTCVLAQAHAALQPRTTEEPTRNSALLAEFAAYCQQYPQLRFWQALRNWSDAAFILFTERGRHQGDSRDTFHWETRDGSKPRTAEGPQ